MAVRLNQYTRELEKNISKGKTLEQAHKRSAAISSTTRKPDKFHKPSFGDKIILALLKKGKAKSGKGG